MKRTLVIAEARGAHDMPPDVAPPEHVLVPGLEPLLPPVATFAFELSRAAAPDPFSLAGPTAAVAGSSIVRPGPGGPELGADRAGEEDELAVFETFLAPLDPQPATNV